MIVRDGQRLAGMCSRSDFCVANIGEAIVLLPGTIGKSTYLLVGERFWAVDKPGMPICLDKHDMPRRFEPRRRERADQRVLVAMHEPVEISGEEESSDPKARQVERERLFREQIILKHRIRLQALAPIAFRTRYIDHVVRIRLLCKKVAALGHDPCYPLLLIRRNTRSETKGLFDKRRVYLHANNTRRARNACSLHLYPETGTHHKD